MKTPLQRARASLEGLSVGDALGERFFGPPSEVVPRIARREVPPGPWRYTDDTEMALSVYEVLEQIGRINPGALADALARRFDITRGYGAGARELILAFQRSASWREAAQLFEGEGSYGNGAAMRAGPIGAFFADDLQAVVDNAREASRVTHTHVDGQAGGIAVAVAAALAYHQRFEWPSLLERVPAGQVLDGLTRAAALDPAMEPVQAARELGSGQRISAADTVPFAIWSAWRSPDDYEQCFWATVAGLGDRDTTCAIAGSIVSLSSNGPPAEWVARRETLPLE
ncbi:MAG: ADP-ribosylglycohydrolase family protein [Vulcanimicrobiota bacterium]